MSLQAQRQWQQSSPLWTRTLIAAWTKFRQAWSNISTPIHPSNQYNWHSYVTDLQHFSTSLTLRVGANAHASPLFNGQKYDSYGHGQTRCVSHGEISCANL